MRNAAPEADAPGRQPASPWSLLALLLIAPAGRVISTYNAAPVVVVAATALAIVAVVWALHQCRRSGLAVVGLSIVGFWLIVTTSVAILPVNSPTEQSRTFSEYLASTGVEYADAPLEVRKAARRLNGLESLEQTLDGPLPPALQSQIDTARTTVDAYRAEHDLPAKRIAFLVEHDGQTYRLSVDHRGRDILARLAWGAQPLLFHASLGFLATLVIAIGSAKLCRAAPWTAATLLFLLEAVRQVPPVVLILLIAVTAPMLDMLALVAAVALALAVPLTMDIRAEGRLDAQDGPGFAATLALRFAMVLSFLATMEYFGIGADRFTMPSWAVDAKASRQMITQFPHMFLYPVGALVSLVVGVQLLSLGLRNLVGRETFSTDAQCAPPMRPSLIS